jgi:hypothetical protein
VSAVGPARGRVGALALLMLAGCGAEPDAGADVEPDTALAEALVALHLADARAAATGEDADSLRAAAYDHVHRATGLDSAGVAARLRAATHRPDEVAAVYERVTRRLDALRRGARPRD